MSFTFIHTADWQLDKPFGGFPSDKQGVLRQARLDVVDKIAGVAASHDAAHVLVAGDGFDTTRLEDSKIKSLLQRLALYPDLTWHLLPGNHDFAATGGFWQRVRKLRPAANAVIHDEAKSFEAEPGVFILPAPLTARTAQDDPTRWMDDAMTGEDTIRIGLAHGAVQGFGSEADASVLISPARTKSARLDYLALGDWHGMQKISDRVWYSGTPEPDRYPNNDPGHALVVTVPRAKALPDVTPVVTRKYIWRQEQLAVSRADEVEHIINDARKLGPDIRHLLLRLDISGVLPLGELNDIEDRFNELEPALFYLDRRFDDLHATSDTSDLESLGHAGLGEAADRLRTVIDDTEGRDRVVSEHALRMLFRFSQQVNQTSGGSG